MHLDGFCYSLAVSHQFTRICVTLASSIQFVKSFLEKIPFKLGYNQSIPSYTKSKVSRLEVRLTLPMCEFVVLYWCHSFSLILQRL